MIVTSGSERVELGRADRATFGRGEDVDLRVATPEDTSVSRQAGLIVFDEFAWRISNTGRRSFFVVEAGAETELRPSSAEHSTHQVLHDRTWIRVPCSTGDAAVVLDVAGDELPSADWVAMSTTSGTSSTQIELGVSLTDNELRSVVAVYEPYLRLPPHYRREPNSYRAAARRISAEEGKVKADLRRVQEKVARAGGPDGRGSRGRDALIAWLGSRGVITADHLSMLGQA